MKKINQKYSLSGYISSSGIASISLHFSIPKISKEEREFALAVALDRVHKTMYQKGYVALGDDFMSPTDLSKKYHHSRQYWEKLLKEGKIYYKETSGGMITTSLWVEAYLKNSKKVNSYVKNRNATVRRIMKSGEKEGHKIECVACGKRAFDFNVNGNSINGLCRSCGFKMDTPDIT